MLTRLVRVSRVRYLADVISAPSGFDASGEVGAVPAMFLLKSLDDGWLDY